jgi:hypothetical protein
VAANPRVPDLDVILEPVDLERVATEMGVDSNLAEHEFLDAKKLVLKACATWLPRDVVEFEVTGIEETVETPWGDPCASVYKGIFDLTGKFKGMFNATKKVKGEKFILDWKTAGRNLDTTWKDRLVDSWQWRMYHMLKPSGVFIYRGINRAGDTREVIMNLGDRREEIIRSTEKQLHHDIKILDNYFDKKADVWSKHMPWSCRGMYECPHVDDCLDDVQPRGCPEKFPNISYSLINGLHNCPEKLRRDLIRKERGLEEKPGPGLRFGAAVHRGLAEIYSQVFGVEYERESEHGEAEEVCE